MKSLELLFIIMFVAPLLVAANNINFDDYFIDKTMRIDYFHIGDAQTEIVTIDRIYQYGIWAGSLNNLIDNFNNGAYYIKIYDAAANVLIYSKGFDSYFKEYQTSEDAAQGIKRTYHESAVIPCPKAKIIFSLEKRDRTNNLNEVFRTEIDPGDVMIIREEANDNHIKIMKSHYSGNPHVKVDVVILSEGYTTEEEGKFKTDLERFTKVFFKLEPYNKLQDKFNIYGIFKPSEESGVDEPRAGIFKNTVLNATFNSLGSERYLLTEDNKAMRNLAAHVPYDAIYIMVNHNRYGGGGIYNSFCTFTSDNQFAEYLFTHEFGHSFSGLADEYYTSETAYNEFYPRGIEPVEPNITALLDPQNVKWKDLLTPGIEVPTPWEKKTYDEKDYAWQKERREMNNRIAELKRAYMDVKYAAEEEWAEEGVIIGKVISTSSDQDSGTITVKMHTAERTFSVIGGITILWKGIEDISITDISEGEETEVGYYTDENGNTIASWIDILIDEEPHSEIDLVTEAEEAYNKKDKEQSDWVTKYLNESKYAGKVGVFEGAGYSAQGLYRPMANCLMFTKQAPLCKVCQAAIARVIKHYTE